MRLIGSALFLMLALAGGARTAAAEEPFLLGPPTQAGPVIVKARFDLRDINDIDDEAETFEFVGVMTLTWKDPRQAFDPAVAGVQEKIFTGAFQFDEISPGWYPQLVLVDETVLYQKSGVMLRVRPDGTATLIETVNAAAEAEFDLHRFPFDGHRLEAVFEVLGFSENEVCSRWSPIQPALGLPGRRSRSGPPLRSRCRSAMTPVAPARSRPRRHSW